MQTNLYIPTTITVGFQERSDTFTGKLGYVIYTDQKGVLRKEASWNGWRDNKIKPVTFDNVPQPGFTLNKGVKRDGYWGSGRSVIRVWDPRDFEFEISIDNLIGILMHADVSKRDITEPCVFAWYGTELVLIPTNSYEYQQSVLHTEKQHKKFSSRDLVVGYTYTVRREQEDVVYLGLLDQYEVKTINEDGDSRSYGLIRGVGHTKKTKKGHVFINPVSKTVYVKDPAAYISNVEVEEVHEDYANLVDEYYKRSESQPIVGITVQPNDDSTAYKNRSQWAALSDTEFVKIRISDSWGWKKEEVSVETFARYNPITKNVDMSHGGYVSRSYYYGQTINPRPLDGLTPNMEQVVELIATIKSRMALASEQAKENTSVIDIASVVGRSLEMGTLQFKLADGKISNNWSF